MAGFTVAEQGHVVQLIVPQTASTALTSVNSMHHHYGRNRERSRTDPP